MQLINDHFQNYKRYQIPKAQLIIADIPYNVGTKAYGSNPSWYEGGDRKNGERPRDHYGVKNCTVAQGMDLARRQAELDALLGDGTVHCKDCASSQEDGHLCYRFAQGVYDEDEGADVITPVEVEPEGSCSWGRRR